MSEQYSCPPGVAVSGLFSPAYADILSPEALAFAAGLARQFTPARDELLRRRALRQERLDRGEKPDFLPETAPIRASEWRVAPVPADLEDRRVEITGPAGDRKMVINAFNSGAKAFMADFEDANSPTWDNAIGGQINLRDAVRRTISYASPEGKAYALNPEIATLIVRPRGWHLPEKHVLVDGHPIPGGILDFALFLFHNAKALLEHGSGPYFYLPKLESHLEARLWNDIFTAAEAELGIPHGSIKATVLIETILATFEIDEILYELRDHAAGLNCGRWDYIFSYIKKLRRDPDAILPDRALVTMTVPFMRAYSLFVIQTCHRRGAHAIGGMAAQIPIKNDPVANEEAISKVRADKEREATDGHDGTWVAHPGLVPVAMEVFDRLMPSPNQLGKGVDRPQPTAKELLAAPEGSITEAGVHTNISVALRYIAAWLNGSGAVPIFHLMEDAATAEISRAQLWQWIHSERGILSDGRRVTEELFESLLVQALAEVSRDVETGAALDGDYEEAAKLVRDITLAQEFVEFLTLPGYERLA